MNNNKRKKGPAQRISYLDRPSPEGPRCPQPLFLRTALRGAPDPGSLPVRPCHIPSRQPVHTPPAHMGTDVLTTEKPPRQWGVGGCSTPPVSLLCFCFFFLGVSLHQFWGCHCPCARARVGREKGEKRGCCFRLAATSSQFPDRGGLHESRP